jgi:hypothetical protein
VENASFAEELGHLKNHVSYPASRAQVVAACNNMSHIETSNRDWFVKSLPEGNYKSPSEVISALLTKV